MYFTTPKPYAIFVLGAGGTGSWLCAFLDKQSQGNNVIVMDGDVVEDKNILRQNFTRKDISRRKAQVVAAEPNVETLYATMQQFRRKQQVLDHYGIDYDDFSVLSDAYEDLVN